MEWLKTMRIKLFGYNFEAHQLTITCVHCQNGNAEPSLFAHEFDGTLQILCDTTHDRSTAVAVGLTHAMYHSLPKEVPMVRAGHVAELIGGQWVVSIATHA